MKNINIKNNKTVLAVIPAAVLLAAGIAFFCSRSGSSDKICQENVERLKQLEAADISEIEDQLRQLSERTDLLSMNLPPKKVFLAISLLMYRSNRPFRDVSL